MIRTALASRPARAGAALAAVAGVALLAGCTPGADDTASEPTTGTGTTAPDTGSATADSTDGGGGDATGTYVDGTYTAEGSYATPETVETITVTVTLEDDVVTAVSVTGDPQKRESEQYQSQFIGGISDAVVGEDIDSLQVSRVSGSSLTSGGFNEAIETIKAEAAA